MVPCTMVQVTIGYGNPITDPTDSSIKSMRERLIQEAPLVSKRRCVHDANMSVDRSLVECFVVRDFPSSLLLLSYCR